MSKWWKFWGGTQGGDKYSAYLEAEPVSLVRRALLWMGPDQLALLKSAADAMGHVDFATPEGGMQKASKEDMEWAIAVDKLAERASSASQARRYADAISHYLKALDEAPGACLYLMSLGSCFAMLRDKKNALRFLQRAHEINPGSSQISSNLNKCKSL
jgi:tetratricopeptide (TPR) repeat protein